MKAIKAIWLELACGHYVRPAPLDTPLERRTRAKCPTCEGHEREGRRYYEDHPKEARR